MKLIVSFETITLSEFVPNYLERYAKVRKSSWQKDAAYLRRNILPVLGDFQLDQITPHQVSNLHAEVGLRAPYEANRTIEVLRTVFKCASQWGLLPRTFENPTNDIQKFKEKKKTRWLTGGEIQQLVPILRSLEPHFSIYYWALMVTGCRSASEMKALKWTDVDVKNSSIYLGKTKNGEPHLLPVPSELMAMLLFLPRKNEYVFPGARYDKKWRQIRKLIPSLHDVRLHDLRHTTASHLLQMGHSLRVVGDVLNHRTLEATNRYAHLSREHLREPLKQLASTLPLPAELMVPIEIVDDEQLSPLAPPVMMPPHDREGISGTVESVHGSVGLRIRHNKKFSVYYADFYCDGVHRHETIGRTDEISLDEARVTCDRILEEKSGKKRERKREKKFYEWDDSLPGFGIKHHKTVSSYVVTFRIGKCRKFVTIGRVDSIPREAALEAAKAFKKSAEASRSE